MKSREFICQLLHLKYVVMDEGRGPVAAFRWIAEARSYIAEQDYPHDFEIVEEE